MPAPGQADRVAHPALRRRARGGDLRDPRPDRRRHRGRRTRRHRRPERRGQDHAPPDHRGDRRARRGRGPAAPKPPRRAARPGGALRRGIRVGAGSPDRGPPWGERRRGDRGRDAGARGGERRGVRPLRGADDPVLRPRWLDARPARRGGALGARLQRGRVRALAGGALGRSADARRARPAPRRGSRPPAPRRAHEPPRPRRDRVARGGGPTPAGRPARGLARPGLPRRHGDPRLGAAGPPPDGIPRRLRVLCPAARGARRADAQGRRDAGCRDLPRAGARPDVPEPAQAREDARARGQARSARPDRHREDRPVASPGPRPRDGRTALGRGGAPRRGPRRRPPGRSGGGARRPAGGVPWRADRDRRPERRREDDAPPHDRGRPAPAGRLALVRLERGFRLPRPGPREPDPGRDGARRPARRGPDDGRRGARLPRSIPVPRR